MSNPCLYVFVNTDLQSMNFGKAMAQSSHCANAFVNDQIYSIGLLENPSSTYNQSERAAIDWYYSTSQGFGTQANLKSDSFYSDLKDLKAWAKEHGYMFGAVVDPTYPYSVTNEVLMLLKDSAVNNIRLSGGMVHLTREETTSFYIFGDRDDPTFKEHMRKWKLHP